MKTYHELVLEKARAELDEARAIARGDIDMARQARVRVCEAAVGLAELAVSKAESVAVLVPQTPAKDGGGEPDPAKPEAEAEKPTA